MWTDSNDTAYGYDDTRTSTFAADGTLSNPNDAAEKTSYVYDALGRQYSASDFTNIPGTSSWTANAATITTYDPASGQTQSVETSLAGDSLGAVHYRYDPATGRKLETYTEHNDTSYVYNDLGELWKLHVTKLNDQTVDQWIIYTYDAVGDLHTASQPNGMTTTYQYDDLNRLDDEIVTWDDPATPDVIESKPVMEFAYTIRSDGLRDDVTETRYNYFGSESGIFSKTFIDYQYDADGRLTDESLTALEHPENAPAAYAYHYTFDLSGNRHQKTVDSGNDQTIDETITYTYNARDQLTLENSDIDAHDVSYRYDPNGSMTEKVTGASGATTVSRYKWDLRNRMVAVDGNGDDLSVGTDGKSTGTVNDGQDTTYTYDVDDVRIEEGAVGASSTYFVIDPINPTGYAKQLEEKIGTNLTTAALARSYVLGLKVEGQKDSTTTAYLLTDGHGSTRQLADLVGNILERDDYDAFGTRMDSGSPLTSWLFGGDGAYDQATGWTYQLARWRSEFQFVSYDSFEADPQFPHPYTSTYMLARTRSMNLIPAATSGSLTCS